MKIGLYQFAPEFGAVERNLERIVGTVRGAEAELWVLPELATTGYLFADRAECAALAETIPGPTTEALAALSRERGTRSVAGLAERLGDRVYNSAAYVGPEGVVAVYRKVHLFDRERLCFDPGPEPFRVHPLGDFRLGMMICFDWMFPEAARSLALQGADLIAHPTNLVLPYCQAAMVTRALENGVACATCNRIGTERRAGVELTFTGRSQVLDPRGRLLGQAAADAEETLVVEVDLAPARDKRITERNDRLGDRRPELYRTSS
ncbi:MAG: acyltransferase [Deltaproteobacteria bacterium]|nr:acyltransferase [Deltaproteobacteria bacterium]